MQFGQFIEYNMRTISKMKHQFEMGRLVPEKSVWD